MRSSFFQSRKTRKEKFLNLFPFNTKKEIISGVHLPNVNINFRSTPSKSRCASPGWTSGLNTSTSRSRKKYPKVSQYWLSLYRKPSNSKRKKFGKLNIFLKLSLDLLGHSKEVWNFIFRCIFPNFFFYLDGFSNVNIFNIILYFFPPITTICTNL